MNAQTQQNPYAPPKAEVEDIADADQPVEQAGRGIRLGAALLDTLVGVIVAAPILISIARNPTWASDPSVLLGASAFISLAASIAWIAVTIVLVKRNGQTIGKKLVGIKVVRSDGSKASLGRIFWLRNIVNAIPSAIPFLGSIYGLVDHLFIFGDKRQCLHDKIADTVVVTA
jgi:uncharacterized RDD family membrane protein YckC